MKFHDSDSSISSNILGHVLNVRNNVLFYMGYFGPPWMTWGVADDSPQNLYKVARKV